MKSLKEDFWSSNDFTKSNIQLTDSSDKTKSVKEKIKNIFKRVRNCFREITVEPCLSIYMLSTAISSLAVQNMHLEKACRVNYNYSDDTCSRLMARNSTGLNEEQVNIQKLVAHVISWKFPLQTGIPAVMVFFIGAWSDRTRKRKICILAPMVGEIITNIGLLLATHFLNEWSLETTALIEALPPALTGSYILMFMGMYSYMTDITSPEERTFRLGIVTIFVTLGTPTGTAISGIMLREIGYYGVFATLMCFHIISLTYGLFRLHDVEVKAEVIDSNSVSNDKSACRRFFALKPVWETVMVACKTRLGFRRVQIISVIILYFLMVGPLYGDSQVSYLYAIQKFSFTEVEYSVYTTINVALGLVGTIFCIYILSKILEVEDSAIGGLAGSSRILACMVFAFAPTRNWFYSAPAFNIFSHTGLTAIRSMATKLVPSDEVAKLSSLFGVAESFAPSVYMPITSTIYSSTIEWFPGAFYIFDAALTIVALLLFGLMFRLARREKSAQAADSSNKEQFARTNEVTTL